MGQKVHPGGFRRPTDGPEVLGILNPVQDHQKRRLSTLAGVAQDLVQIGIPLGRDKGDHPLVPSLRHEPIQGRLGLDVNGHPSGAGEADHIAELTILTEDENSKEGTGAGPERLPDGMETVQDRRGVIVSSDWCHPGDPRS